MEGSSYVDIPDMGKNSSHDSGSLQYLGTKHIIVEDTLCIRK